MKFSSSLSLPSTNIYRDCVFSPVSLVYGYIQRIYVMHMIMQYLSTLDASNFHHAGVNVYSIYTPSFETVLDWCKHRTVHLDIYRHGSTP